MLERLFETSGSVVPLVLRLGLAVVIFPHGAQKVLGWFGGHRRGQHIGLPLVFFTVYDDREVRPEYGVLGREPLVGTAPAAAGLVDRLRGPPPSESAGP